MFKALHPGGPDEGKNEQDENDTTAALLLLLGEIQKLSSAVNLLAERIPLAKERQDSKKEPIRQKKAWITAAEAFASSDEASALASKHQLTLEIVAARVGLPVDDSLTRGLRQHLGKCLMAAGYCRVSGPGGGAADYRRL